jgi:hypothetical protein
MTSSDGRLWAQFSSTSFEKVSNWIYLELHRTASFINMICFLYHGIKHKLEKQKDLVGTELAADSESGAYELDNSVEDSEVEAEL